MFWLNNNERSYEKGITEEDLFCIIIFTDHPPPSMPTLADRVGDLVSAQPFNSSLWPLLLIKTGLSMGAELVVRDRRTWPRWTLTRVQCLEYN